jgi:DNA-binding transcriptional LysR family regulator
MDKIHAMQLFIRVAELESFSRAADTLGLPKGSVSRQIQALESHLGTRLLHRTTRRVQLTQDGMVYYERAKICSAISMNWTACFSTILQHQRAAAG